MPLAWLVLFPVSLRSKVHKVVMTVAPCTCARSGHASPAIPRAPLREGALPMAQRGEPGSGRWSRGPHPLPAADRAVSQDVGAPHHTIWAQIPPHPTSFPAVRCLLGGHLACLPPSHDLRNGVEARFFPRTWWEELIHLKPSEH